MLIITAVLNTITMGIFFTADPGEAGYLNNRNSQFSKVCKMEMEQQLELLDSSLNKHFDL